MLGFDLDYDEEYVFHRKLALVILGLAPIVVFVAIGFRPPTYGKHVTKATSHNTTQVERIEGKSEDNHLISSSETASEISSNGKPSSSSSSSLRKRRGFNNKKNSYDTTDVDYISTDSDGDLSDKTDSKNDDNKKEIMKGGKHRMGPLLSARWSWMVFESPPWIWVVFSVWQFYYGNQEIEGGGNKDLPRNNKIMLGWFCFHYLYRSLWYPLVMMKNTEGQNQKTSKGMPLGIACSAWAYCCVNGYLQARDLTKFRIPAPTVSGETHTPSPHNYQFWFGVFWIVVGFYIVNASDRILLKLKEEKQRKLPLNGCSSSTSHYAVPRGGLFEYVSSPHYFGELIEWTGFCIANDCSLASFSFVVFSASNLVPRAIHTHEWYIEKFKGTNGNYENSNPNKEFNNDSNDCDENVDYSQLGRKAVIPFIL